MLSNDFFESKHSYCVSIADMDTFLKECEAEGLMWSHGLKPTEFNPFKFYEGDNTKFIEPIQKIDNRNKVYIKCFDSRLYFQFNLGWFATPYMIYKEVK